MNKSQLFAGLFIGLIIALFGYMLINAARESNLLKPSTTLCESSVPRAAYIALLYYERYQQAPPGFIPVKTFYVTNNQLPETDDSGKAIIYIESDVSPSLPGINRGRQRIVIGSNGIAYYTDDHYRTFIKINTDCIRWFIRNSR